MPSHKLFSSTALCLSLLGAPALADVTADQVWADWKAYLQGFGYDLNGQETRDGATLTVSGIGMDIAVPDGEFRMEMPDITFTETGDGAVSVNLPEVMPMTYAISPDQGEALRGTITYTQDSPTMIVTGVPEDMTYTYAAESVSMTMSGLPMVGSAATQEVMNMTFRMSAPAGTMRMAQGDLRTYTQNMTANTMTYDVSFADPRTNDRAQFSGNVADMVFSGTGDIPQNSRFDPENPAAMFDAGFAFSGNFKFGAGQTDFSAQSSEGTLEGSATAGTTRLDMSFSREGLGYDIGQTGLSVNAQVPGLPFPLAMDMEESGFNISLPMGKSDDPQDFAFGMTLGNFTMSDMIWAMFDPAAQLPRDPATIAVDLTGTARMLVDVMNPGEVAAAGPDAAPGELETLNVRKILLRAVGAEVSGNGAFRFDNSDKVTFDGMPKPTGKLNVSVVGANALIDKLVAMGFLPQEQAMGARMMMGLFGVPGQAPDTLNSVIEVNDQGHVLANGQRIR